jgi:hypothetical protein
MNQSKFSLADLLILLGALGFGLFCFLSLNFLSLGKTGPSLFWAAMLALILGGFALGAKLLKKTSRKFKTCFIWEVILLALFGGVALFAIFPFSHYFAVSNQKDEIQKKVSDNITQAENMFAKYERYAEDRESSYRDKLHRVVAAKYTQPGEYANYFEHGVDDNMQIENKMFTLHADLYPSNYEDMKKGSTEWLINAKNAVAYWYSISIVDVVNDVEKNSKNWLAKLTEFSTVRAQGEQTQDFTYALSFDDIKRYFTTPGTPTWLSAVLAVLAYVLMLLSYLITRRSTKTTICTKPSKGEFDIHFNSLK